MKPFKPYQEVLAERQKQKNEKLYLENNESNTVSEQNKNLITNYKTQALSKDLKEIPGLGMELILHNESISPEIREQLALIKDEMIHGYHVQQRRRTDCEKRISVLQDNRFTTHGSKFFQANLEQQVHGQSLVGLTLEIEETNIDLEKLMFEYKKLENKISQIKYDSEIKNLNKNEDQLSKEVFVFSKERDELFLLEKDLQLLSIKIRRKLTQLKEQKMNAENESLELLEWSKIKEEEFALALMAGEAFNPEDANYGQFIHLAKRFFQNYLTTHTTNADATTSDVLNIDGLCLTALNIGRKNNLLDKMFEGFSFDEIKFIWKGIYGQIIEFVHDEQGQLQIKIVPNNA